MADFSRQSALRTAEVNGPAVHPSTFPDETGAMMWVTDALGKRRISQTNGGTGRHHWRWDPGWNPISEYEDANATWWPTTKVKANYPGLAEKNELTGVYRYYSTDRLGSVRRMRNDAKASLATYEYEPYGGAYYNSGLALNVGFTGHQWDSNMGLYFAPYRWYNPSAARWLTRDPLGMVDTVNGYVYAMNNPSSHRDLFGLTIRDVLPGWDKPWKARGVKCNCPAGFDPPIYQLLGYKSPSACASGIFGDAGNGSDGFNTVWLILAGAYWPGTLLELYAWEGLRSWCDTRFCRDHSGFGAFSDQVHDDSGSGASSDQGLSSYRMAMYSS